MISIWKSDALGAQKVEREITATAAVVGGGLTGVILAYLLGERGIDTVLLEAETVASGKTARTTAKVTVAHGYHYAALMEKISREAARKYAAMQMAGLRFFADHGTPGEVRELYLYTLYGESRIRRELEAMRDAGIECEPAENPPLPFTVTAAVRVPGQRIVNPAALAEKLCREGKFRVYEHSPVTIGEGNSLTACGHRIRAEKIAVCTNYPAGVSWTTPVKLCRKSSCAVLMSSENGFGMPENVMACGIDGGYNYRYAEGGLIVSGESHRGAPAPNAEQRLTDAVRQFAPDAAAEEAWTNNDTYTHDGLPYAGEMRKNLWIAGGYNAWGMTNAAGAAIILAEQMCGRALWYADIASPKRNFLRGGGSDFAEYLSTTMSGVSKAMSAVPEMKPEEVERGCAAVVNYQGRRAGAYRDEEGQVHLVSLKCPHMGCELAWNAVDCTWDCPCHGSRFGYNGECLSNPAERGVRME